MKIVCLAVLLGVASPGLAAYRIRSAQVAGKQHLLLADIAGFYGMKIRVDGNDIRLTSQWSDLRLTLDRREARINGVVINLTSAPTKWTDQPVVAETDFHLVLEPVLRTAVLPKDEVRHIVIDPGHGGNDEGARGKLYAEKDLTLAVARQLAVLLKRYGYRVSLTRDRDVTVALDTRPAFAVKAGADLFISLHINAVAGNSRTSGIETFLLTPEGTASTYSGTTKAKASTGNAFDVENMRLAYDVQRYLKAAAGSEDRGVKHANFRVLRDAPCPAVLIEMGFITNAAEERLLGNRDQQNRIALGIARGIVAYSRAVKK